MKNGQFFKNEAKNGKKRENCERKYKMEKIDKKTCIQYFVDNFL